MFEHKSEFAQTFIVNFFNKSWASGVVPKCGKEAVIVPISKPGKIKSDPALYRPIALTSNFGKMMERLIVIRLHWFCEKDKLFNFFQSGF